MALFINQSLSFFCTEKGLYVHMCVDMLAWVCVCVRNSDTHRVSWSLFRRSLCPGCQWCSTLWFFSTDWVGNVWQRLFKDLQKKSANKHQLMSQFLYWTTFVMVLHRAALIQPLCHSGVVFFYPYHSNFM